MSEEKEGVWEAVGAVRKFHPVALLIMLAFMYLTIQLLTLDMPMDKKIVPVFFSLVFYFVAVFFEMNRLNQKEAKQLKL